MKDIKLTIREKRAERGWTLEELAERVEISIPYLSQLERGADKKQPSARLIGKFAEVFGCQPGDLFAETGGGQSVAALLADYDRLSREQQDMVRNFARALLVSQAAANDR